MFTQAEENYLKTIYNVSIIENISSVSTNAIAKKLQTKASSVTDMLSKLATKKLVHYVKYQGVSLTKKGLTEALLIVRKHRLWEVFLVEKLDFKWDEVHELAEQLEHIKSETLIDRLDKLLKYPSKDPHGDPIPNKYGKINIEKEILLINALIGDCCLLIGVKDSSTLFLRFLDTSGVQLGSKIKVLKKEQFDNSIVVKIKNKEFSFSEKIAKNLIVKQITVC